VFFSFNLFIPPSSPVYDDLQISGKFFNDDGSTITFYQYDYSDYHKESSQARFNQFETALLSNKFYSKNVNIW